MKMITSRELRANLAQVWRDLPKEREIVITSHGKPVALLMPTSAECLEESLETVRRTRALQAVQEMQRRSVELGLDKMTLEEINAEIDAYRREQPAE